MKKGIIFDMDGTMVDNMMVHHRAWQRKLAELGLDLSIDEVKEKIHGINEEILERIFGDRFTVEERRRISWEKEAAYREIFLPELRLLPGLQGFLEMAKAANIPMAIGTAAPTENVEFVMDNLRLHPYFKGVFDAKSVTKGKPDPEIFHVAAAAMGLSTADCLIFEDSVTGAEAARRAGAQAVIVTTTHGREEFAHFNHIVRFVEDFEGLELRNLGLIG
ncbi:MAG: HAD-IA family hydrolase [Saprospiraceae bacterium]|nr:HAD-IA family hydrolase [Saprospiraceae bacterium]